jgi:hypothetical protein
MAVLTQRRLLEEMRKIISYLATGPPHSVPRQIQDGQTHGSDGAAAVNHVWLRRGAYCSPAYYQEAAPRMVAQRREGTVGKSAVSPKRKGRTLVLRQNAIESERDWITGVYTHNLGQ